jgi:hypothetical protein
VHFGFDGDDLAFRDTVRDLLDKECPPEAVRAAAGPGPLDRGLWDRLAEMGVLAILVPGDRGGLGLDERSLVLLLEEAGRAALPHPLVETAAVAAPLVGADAGMVATDLGGPHVPCAADADRLLLHRDGGGLALVAPHEVTLTPVATVDPARRCAAVTLRSGVHEGVPWPSQTPDDAAAAFDRGAWGTAAVLVGLGARMVEMTVAHVRERHQFGVPVGSFQAVKHQLADAHKDLAFARPAVHRAAHSLATGAATVTRDVSMAKALASDAAWRAGRAALQCHGAIGYTVEHDLHLYLKRTWALAKAWGDAAWHRDRVATAIGI